MHPTISVVIPNHSRTAELRLAIDSVLAQAYAAHEIIVVYQPRPDVADILRDYAGRVTFIPTPSVEGPANPIAVKRNAGIAAATGHYVAFLDDDDVWHRRKLQIQVEAIARSRVAVVLCCAQVEALPLPLPHEFDWPIVSQGERVLTLLEIASASRVSTSTVMVAREALRDGGFSTDPATEAVEDYRLWLELSERGAFLKVRSPLIRFAVSPESSFSAIPTRRHSRAAFAFASSAASARLQPWTRFGIVAARMTSVLRHPFHVETDRQFTETARALGLPYQWTWSVLRSAWRLPGVSWLASAGHRWVTHA